MPGSKHPKRVHPCPAGLSFLTRRTLPHQPHPLFVTARGCSLIGTYSAASASTCTPCPAGTYNPSTGLADQGSGTCLACPTGSIALVGNGSPVLVTTFNTILGRLEADPALVTTGAQSMNTATNIETNDYRNGLALSVGATFCAAW